MQPWKQREAAPKGHAVHWRRLKMEQMGPASSELAEEVAFKGGQPMAGSGVREAEHHPATYGCTGSEQPCVVCKATCIVSKILPAQMGLKWAIGI